MISSLLIFDTKGTSLVSTYRVVARVISQKGTCAAGHQIGNEYFIEDTIAPKICPWAFQSIFPFFAVLKYNGHFPWENDPDKCTVACPDPGNPVIFELQRIKIE